MSLTNTIKFVVQHPLNRERKINSIIRFVKWQLGSRVLSGEYIYEWINGSKFLVRNGETGLTGNIYTGLHEFNDMGFMLHFIRADDLFIDVGANVGSYTLLACSAIGARGVAFEPVPNTHSRLVENIRLNHLDSRVQCLNKAVADRDGSITFTSNNDTTNHVLAAAEKCDDELTVEVIR